MASNLVKGVLYLAYFNVHVLFYGMYSLRISRPFCPLLKRQGVQRQVTTSYTILSKAVAWFCFLREPKIHCINYWTIIPIVEILSRSNHPAIDTPRNSIIIALFMLSLKTILTASFVASVLYLPSEVVVVPCRIYDVVYVHQVPTRFGE